jgi:NAD(P)H-dependent FMN reductase
MKKILVLAGTSHRSSINLALASHAASQLEEAEITTLDLNDFEMPIYSEDVEEASGIPQPARDFVGAIQASDGVILSLAEHNGSYTAAFKNVLDWASRVEQKLWSEKPMLLMASSPGGRGGANVLEAAKGYLPHLGAAVAATFSLPSFYDNFSADAGISDESLKAELAQAVDSLQSALS